MGAGYKGRVPDNPNTLKIKVISLNLRILNIIHKHLLKENNYNDQAIEIRSGCIINNNMHTIHKQHIST